MTIQKSANLIASTINNVFANTRYSSDVTKKPSAKDAKVVRFVVAHSCKRPLSEKVVKNVTDVVTSTFSEAGGKLSISKKITNEKQELVLIIKIAKLATKKPAAKKSTSSTKKTPARTKAKKPTAKKAAKKPAAKKPTKSTKKPATKTELAEYKATLLECLEKYTEKRVGFPKKLFGKRVTIGGTAYKIAGFKSVNKIAKPVALVHVSGEQKGVVIFESIAAVKKAAK